MEIIKYARKKIPDLAVRTTFIVGFPGESDEDFEELLDFVEEMKFDRVGVFEYSHEEDTSAYKYDDELSDEAKSYRANKLMSIQRDISFDNNSRKIGQTLKVLVDSKEGEYYVGRTQYDSPEVDNEVLITAANDIEIGQFYDVEIEDAEEYDLYGKI